MGKSKGFKRGSGFRPQALKPPGNSLSCMQAATIARTCLKYKQCLSAVQCITISNPSLRVKKPQSHGRDDMEPNKGTQLVHPSSSRSGSAVLGRPVRKSLQDCETHHRNNGNILGDVWSLTNEYIVHLGVTYGPVRPLLPKG
jgi:hypothetical protein